MFSYDNITNSDYYNKRLPIKRQRDNKTTNYKIELDIFKEVEACNSYKEEEEFFFDDYSIQRNTYFNDIEWVSAVK